MTKKEFEKETYLAPEWGMRIVRVERNYLQDVISPGDAGYDPIKDEDDLD